MRLNQRFDHSLLALDATLGPTQPVVGCEAQPLRQVRPPLGKRLPAGRQIFRVHMDHHIPAAGQMTDRLGYDRLNSVITRIDLLRQHAAGDLHRELRNFLAVR